MRRIGIVCALTTEARQVSRAAPGRVQSRSNHSPRNALRTLADGSLLLVSGMGGPAAAAAAQALIDAGATRLMSAGLAGGLDPALTPGALFLPSEVIAYDPPLRTPSAASATHPLPLATDVAWRTHLATTLASLRPQAHGTLLTSPRAIATVDAKIQLFRATGGGAVDMEGAAVASVARRNQVPFVALKVIVDGAGTALPRAALAATDANGDLHPWRLLAALARAPAELLSLGALALDYRAASRTLRGAARLAFAGDALI
jgi:nucleoside phosphorylase